MFARRLINSSVVRGAAAGRQMRFNAPAVVTTAARMASDHVEHPVPKGQVTTEMARAMPKLYYEMPNDVLLTMAVMGDQDAREERLIREIMAVDDTCWYDPPPPRHASLIQTTSSN